MVSSEASQGMSKMALDGHANRTWLAAANAPKMPTHEKTPYNERHSNCSASGVKDHCSEPWVQQDLRKMRCKLYPDLLNGVLPDSNKFKHVLTSAIHFIQSLYVEDQEMVGSFTLQIYMSHKWRCTLEREICKQSQEPVLQLSLCNTREMIRIQLVET